MDQPSVPLVRVRVEYIKENCVLAVGRFGQNFLQKVANPGEILLFKKMLYAKTPKDESGLTAQDLEELVPENMAALKIEDYVEEFLESSGKNLELLGSKGLGSAVDLSVRKKSKNAIKGLVEKQMNKIVEKMNEMEVDDEVAFENTLLDFKKQNGSGENFKILVFHKNFLFLFSPCCFHVKIQAKFDL